MDHEVEQYHRDKIWKIIEQCKFLDWQLLTKRVGNAKRMLPAEWMQGGLPHHVWFGITVVNQEEADRDIPKLYTVPAEVRWLSMEPLLGPVQLPPGPIDWVVIGGESGAKRREMDLRWLENIVTQCRARSIPIWVKQDSAFFPGQQGGYLTSYGFMRFLKGKECLKEPMDNSILLSEVEPARVVLTPEVLTPEPVQVTCLPKLMGLDRMDFSVPAGQSIAEILRELNLYPPPEAAQNVRLFLGDVLVPMEFWESWKPKGNSFLILRIIPTGSQGGGAGKMILRAVIVIAATVLSFWAGGALGGVAAGAMFGASSAATGVTVGGFIGAGIGAMVGGLMANALVPPPRPKKPDALGIEASPSLGGVGNQLNRYGVIPKIFGSYRVFPPTSAVALEAK